MAELFYPIRALGLDREAKIRRYAELNNRHIEALGPDRAKLHRLGFCSTRVQKGPFASESIPKLVENYRTSARHCPRSDERRSDELNARNARSVGLGRLQTLIHPGWRL